MTAGEIIGALMALMVAALGGGFLGQLVNRRWTKQESAKKETVAEKQLEVNVEQRIREELRAAEAAARAAAQRAEREEEVWRNRCHDAEGAKRALETELATMRPKYIDLIQQNQHLIAENETLKLRAGRRLTDQTTETLYRIEQAGAIAAKRDEAVADDLAGSHARADAAEGPHGAAADAASKSDNGGAE